MIYRLSFCALKGRVIMNNDFIQELKEKRERYGVSQSRLAVACGISREYYNRIENGKVQLTEALKEEIQKQLERFNPEEPLFLLIDYFRVRFPTTDVQTVIQKTIALKRNIFFMRNMENTVMRKVTAWVIFKSWFLIMKCLAFSWN